MLARADSFANSNPSAASAAPFPAWARAVHAPETEAEAAFLAGAALARLDAVVRETPPWAGVLRQRLALRAAAASVARSGRSEDEPALRDALHLTRPGADPGPAGQRLRAWRALAAGSLGQWRSAIAVAAERLQIASDAALQAAIAAAEACVASPRPAPFAAARAHERARPRRAPAAGRGGAGESELLAAWLADSVLAQKLTWPCALPLLAAPLFSAAGRRAAGNAVDGDATARVLFAWARGAGHACDLAAELRRRAQKLAEAAPKLRAKGAKAALQALLDEDSLAAATPIAGLSERGTRRLFERLAALGAIRELTGRATFRLYGL